MRNSRPLRTLTCPVPRESMFDHWMPPRAMAHCTAFNWEPCSCGFCSNRGRIVLWYRLSNIGLNWSEGIHWFTLLAVSSPKYLAISPSFLWELVRTSPRRQPVLLDLLVSKDSAIHCCLEDNSALLRWLVGSRVIGGPDDIVT